MQKRGAVRAIESRVPRAGAETWVGDRESSTLTAALQCLLPPYWHFLSSPKSPDSSLMANLKMWMVVFSCLSSIYLLCDIHGTLLLYVPHLLCWFYSSVLHHKTPTLLNENTYCNMQAVFIHMFLDFNCMTQEQRKTISGLSQSLNMRWYHSQLL